MIYTCEFGSCFDCNAPLANWHYTNTHWQITAIISDKQRGLVPAIAKVFPGARHGLCQMHYLKNLAQPIAAADRQVKVEFRKQIRDDVGDLIRQELSDAPGLMTVTGIIPSPVDDLKEEEEEEDDDDDGDGDDGGNDGGGNDDNHATDCEPLSKSQTQTQSEIESIVSEILRRVRYLLSLKGRPPFCMAGVEMYNRLCELTDCLSVMLAHQCEPRLLRLFESLNHALDQFCGDFALLNLAETWLHTVAEILCPDDKPDSSSTTVKAALDTFIDELVPPEQINQESSLSIDDHIKDMTKVTAGYAVGLFHTYDIEALPRTNNEIESQFRDLQRRLLSTTGQVGLTKRLIHRSGAWELLPCPSDFGDLVSAISSVPDDEFREEQQRLCTHRRCFRLHTRSAKQSGQQLKKLVAQWCTL